MKETNFYTSQKIWDIDDITRADGQPPEPPPSGEIHPDLIRYKGYWYCGLKECPQQTDERGVKYLKSRRYPCGGSRIIRSADGENGQSVKFIKWQAGRVTDLKFSITCGEQQRPDKFGVYLLKAPLPK